MSYENNINTEQEKNQRIYDNFLDDMGILKDYLKDETITDIKVTGSGEIILEKLGKPKEFTGKFLTPAKVRGIILSAAAMLKIDIDYSKDFPKLECVLPKPYNLRFTGLLPPAVTVPQIAMRRPPKRIFTLEEYVENGQLQKEHYDLICDYIKERKNILIGGSTGSGKTTFSNAILQKMVEYTPNDAFYIVEDVQELQCNAKDVTFIGVTRESAAEAVRTALRWTPNRIIFGEVRYGAVADELIKSWNTGHTGNFTTIHADSAKSMLIRMEDILGEVIKGKLPDLTQVIHLCVHLTKSPQGRFIDEVIVVKPRTKDFMNIVRESGLV